MTDIRTLDPDIQDLIDTLRIAEAEMERILDHPPIGYALLVWYELPWWKRWFTPMPTSSV